jgi:hypothetical protein
LGIVGFHPVLHWTSTGGNVIVKSSIGTVIELNVSASATFTLQNISGGIGGGRPGDGDGLTGVDGGRDSDRGGSGGDGATGRTVETIAAGASLAGGRVSADCTTQHTGSDVNDGALPVRRADGGDIVISFNTVLDTGGTTGDVIVVSRAGAFVELSVGASPAFAL